MHLQLPHDTLLKLVDLVAKVADKHHRYEILANIRFDLSQTTLVLTASDLEMELSTTLTLPSGACLLTGSTTVSASKLHEICKSLPSGMNVELNADDGRCLIVAGKSKFTLPTLPASNFPSIGTPVEPMQITIARSDLLDGISKTRFAIAHQEVRHYLTGMLLQIAGNQFTTVATDGHRLAVSHRMLAEDNSGDTQVIVAGKAVGELERLLNELGKTLNMDDLVSLYIDGEFLQVRLNFGKPDENGKAGDELVVAMTTRLIEGKFPDYRRIIPTTHTRTVIMQKDEIINVLRRVSILSDERLRGVVFEFSDADSAVVRTASKAQGEAVESISVNFSGEPTEISVNDLYLKSVCNVLTGQISIQFGNPNEAMIVKQVGDERQLYLVMPMRV